VRFPKHGLNQKKGISSIVGGIFFLVLMTSGFTVYYVALDSQSQMLNTQQIIADSEVAKIKEKFVVAASSSGVNNVLSVQVVNTGYNTVEIADVWIINKTVATENATKYNDLDFRDVSIPVGYGGNVLENHAPLYLTPTIYDIKVISSLGTIQKVEFDVNGGSNVLNAQMVAIPQDVRFGENVTVALIITNSGIDTLTNVKPKFPLDVSPNQCQNTPNLIFGGPSTLLSSQSTMFFWDCVLDQPIGNTITFRGNATAKLGTADIDSNDATDSVIVRDFTSGEGEEIVLKDELFGRPQLLMLFPNPVGEDPDENDRGIWGVMVANPTDQKINVTKVVIVAVSPRATSSDYIFRQQCEGAGSNLNPITIAPTSNNWSCPESNQLQWKNVANPQTVQPRSVFPFLVEMGTDVIGGNQYNVTNIPIQTTVFTTLGQFGKAGYLSSINKEDVAMPNVFLSSTIGSASPANVLGEIRSIDSGASVTFNVTLADMDEGTAYGINADSRLIINIPKEWTIGTVISQTGFKIPVTQNDFPDGSTQLIGKLISYMSGNDDAKTIQFTATAPTVTKAKMYVMHILSDGIATGSGGTFSIGPIAEAVIQVCPATGGPQPECPL